ncbi:MAG TPA: glycosyl hydrolase [Candidatus Hydrogenedentes bacterium]|nr:glycosyl hydrolase [Candidatus Hydrogenedentota bacterium]
MKIDMSLSVRTIREPLSRFFAMAGPKIARLHSTWDPAKGAPVFTVRGRYTTRGWTEWTQGFVGGLPILQFDATGDERFWRIGREYTFHHMASHVSHTGVHDHGFNNVSTYGNLRRLALEGRVSESADAIAFYELALKVSGAVQASRWSRLADGTGFIHSFNGPHSLFSDTIRSCRSLIVAHQLGHCLMGEHDARISLLDRAIQHIRNTSRYNVYFGEGRDAYDVRGRVAHESIFNMTDGRYRCPSTQQGYSPFSTWTRGLAWIILGYAEELEAFATLDDSEFEPFGGRKDIESLMLETAAATADFYIANTPSDGIPYWDTGAPGLANMPRHLEKPAQIDNPCEPVDSSAAAIAAQGLLRLGRYLEEKYGGTSFRGKRSSPVPPQEKRGQQKWERPVQGAGKEYWQAGLTVAKTLFAPPYLSENPKHQGLLLHSVYHRPNGWDYIPPGKHVPQGESSMWGDYHAMELAVYLKRGLDGKPFPNFFGPSTPDANHPRAQVG